MTEKQRKKANFRKSSKWVKFRHLMNVLQKGIDPITKRKLYAGFNVHHLILDDNKYTDLSKTENFIAVNKKTHENIHWLFDYYKKDPEILTRLKEVLDKMKELNNG